jgi:hypothetical protein
LASTILSWVRREFADVCIVAEMVAEGKGEGEGVGIIVIDGISCFKCGGVDNCSGSRYGVLGG